MSIDKTGKWWVGDQPSDIREYLEAYGSAGYKVNEFRLAKCPCGSERFYFWADDDEDCARKQCESCEASSFIGDSEDYWEDANPKQWKCVICKSKAKVCNLGVGFSLYEDGEVRWLYVGQRCVDCGVLGCFAGWKIAYSPSRKLLEQV